MQDQADLLDALNGLVGPSGLIADAEGMKPYLADWRGRYLGAARCVVRPASTEQVAAVVRHCAANRIAIVPQGGNTGLCGGATPHPDGSEIVLSLTRMKHVRSVDLDNDTITVEAGCVLADLQARAVAMGRLFPLSLAAEGSCTLGGNLSTNAGGVQVLKYGNTRELVLGLEVVLADGQVWDGLRGLRKDNTGYDLKHLFIGAEGTLGVITAAVLKLFPLPRARVTALIALADPPAAVQLLKALKALCGDRLSGFELMSRICIEFVVRHMPGSVDPLPADYPWYVLVELTDAHAGADLREQLEIELGKQLEAGQLLDAVIASSEAQANQLWALRENISQAQRPEGASIKHDVSIPVSAVPDFLDQTGAALEAVQPGCRVVAFGHLGDGNLHYNLSRPVGGEDAAFLARMDVLNQIVHDQVHARHGSISAEHGLGQLKREAILRYKSGLEMELMRGIKRLLDPNGLMNPGKVV